MLFFFIFYFKIYNNLDVSCIKYSHKQFLWVFQNKLPFLQLTPTEFNISELPIQTFIVEMPNCLDLNVNVNFFYVCANNIWQCTMWWHSWQSLSTLFLSSMHLCLNPHIHLHMHTYKHIQYTRHGVVSMQEMLFKWPCLHMTLNDPHTPELYPSETGSSLWSVCELNGGHSLVYSELLAPELVASLLWDSRLQYLVQKETFFFLKSKNKLTPAIDSIGVTMINTTQ